MLARASSAPRTSTSMAGPSGSQPCSSSRIHCTRTGRPDRAREERGVGGRVVGAVVAVAAGAFHEDHPDSLGRQPRSPASGAPQLVRRPGLPVQIVGLARAHVGDTRRRARSRRGSGRASGSRPRARPAPRARAPSTSPRLTSTRRGGRRAAKRLVQRGRRGQPPPAAPGDHERARGGDRLLLALADDAEKAALAHYRDARRAPTATAASSTASSVRAHAPAAGSRGRGACRAPARRARRSQLPGPCRDVQTRRRLCRPPKASRLLVWASRVTAG